MVEAADSQRRRNNDSLCPRWDAKQDCIRRGGRLFEPRWFFRQRRWWNKTGRSKELNELVYSNVPGPGKCYWVGISDIEAENKYAHKTDLHLIEGTYCSGTFMPPTIRNWLTPTSGQATQSGKALYSCSHQTQSFSRKWTKWNDLYETFRIDWGQCSW